MCSRSVVNRVSDNVSENTLAVPRIRKRTIFNNCVFKGEGAGVMPPMGQWLQIMVTMVIKCTKM